jgi:hypothetical protein
VPGNFYQGMVEISTASAAASAPRGLYWMRADPASTAAISAVAALAAANVTLTTGALTGTTGVDGNMTLAPHIDGRLYVENRSGATRVVGLTFRAG